MRAVLHRPAILFLDEPTTGLDPQARRDVWAMVQGFRSRDTTVVLTTHYMEEAEQLSERILMMHQGKALLEGTAAHLKAALGQKDLYEVVLADDGAAGLEAALAAMPCARAVKVLAPDTLTVECEHPNPLGEMLAVLPGERVRRLGRVTPSLESLYLALAQNGSLAGMGEGMDAALEDFRLKHATPPLSGDLPR